MQKIGVIADNHSFINPRVYDVFDDVELILHAGDIGTMDVITSLEALAPVSAVYGNIDTFPLVSKYPEIFAIEISGVSICVTHIFPGLHDSKVQELVRDKLGGQLDIFICGHSHKAKVERIGSTFVFNPGSAGKRRFRLRPAVGLINIYSLNNFTPEIIYLD